jgi:hypothetical protein
LGPGANPTIVSYNASAVKNYYAIADQCDLKTFFFFYIGFLKNALVYDNAGVVPSSKIRSRMIGSWQYLSDVHQDFFKYENSHLQKALLYV